jgi:gliding motility-associated protein GldL
MSVYSKYNLVYRLQKWMDTVAGQTFLNYTYSWGASVVILGALFKLTHLPGANVMLFIGMGTEVFVFFISAFDRPFDKTAEGREMPTHLTEEFLASGKVQYTAAEEAAAEQEEQAESGAAPQGVEGVRRAAASVSQAAGPTVIFTGGTQSSVSSPQAVSNVAQSVADGSQPVVNGQSASEDGSTVMSPGAAQVGAGVQQPMQPNFVPQMSAEEAAAMNEAQGNYVEELKTLVETLKKVNEQSTRLTRDSEEMENLNRTLTGISKIYEMQLKGASQQVGTIDQINDQTRKMAEQIERLNQIYARMIEAMTVNMHVAAPGAPLKDKE